MSKGMGVDFRNRYQDKSAPVVLEKAGESPTESQGVVTPSVEEGERRNRPARPPSPAAGVRRL